MADMRFLEADHQRAKLRQGQPLRHLPAQHAAFGATGDALAGDDKHEGEAVVMRTLQEPQQRPMCARLRHAMQVEAGVDFAVAL